MTKPKPTPMEELVKEEIEDYTQGSSLSSLLGTLPFSRGVVLAIHALYAALIQGNEIPLELLKFGGGVILAVVGYLLMIDKLSPRK